jgi:hypothetical protein
LTGTEEQLQKAVAEKNRRAAEWVLDPMDHAIEYSWACAKLATRRQRAGDDAAAIADCERAAQVVRDALKAGLAPAEGLDMLIVLQHQLARILVRSRDGESALLVVDEALLLDAESPTMTVRRPGERRGFSLIARADIYKDLGRLQEALDDCIEAALTFSAREDHSETGRDPVLASAMSRVAWLLERTGDAPS